jgi:RNA polymerase sigma-70 factor (ECF subfamily)
MNALKVKTKKLSKAKLDAIRSDMAVAFIKYDPDMERLALYKTNNVELSHDLVQATFLRTLLYLQKGGKVHLMRSFLNHVLNDLVIDEYRKHKTASLDVLLEKGFDLSFDDNERLMNVFDGKAVVLLIPLLPEKYESVIRMRYLQGLSLKEIALLTKQSENTVAVQAHRGVAKLKKIYDEVHQ